MDGLSYLPGTLYKVTVLIITYLLGEVSHFINPQAASRGNGAVEEARVQQRPVHITARLVFSFASQAVPETILLLTFSQCLKQLFLIKKD